MDNIKDIAGVTILSAAIGLFVGGLFDFLATGQFATGMAYGSIAGAINGFICQFSFMLVYTRLRRHPVIAFSVVIAIIAAGTCMFCVLWRVSFPIPSLPIVLVSEILGIAATAILFRKYTRLNERLREKIKELNGER